MPARIYERIKLGKHTGIVFSQRVGMTKKEAKGCWVGLYWLTIGWVIFVMKWFFIGIFKAGKFIWKRLSEWDNAITDWIIKYLADHGKNVNRKWIKAGVTFVFCLPLIILFIESALPK